MKALFLLVKIAIFGETPIFWEPKTHPLGPLGRVPRNARFLRGSAAQFAAPELIARHPGLQAVLAGTDLRDTWVPSQNIH